MARILIRDCRLFDGSGRPSYPADVLVQGNRFEAVAADRGQLAGEGAEIIEAAGRTLMPGLIEGHAHLSFVDVERPTDLGDLPPEEHVLRASYNARLLLDRGFTSAYSAASARMRIDIALRNEIEAGRLTGPRMRACGPEITVTGGLGDDRQMHQQRSSFAVIADGVDEVLRIARTCLREGADSIKLNISGDGYGRVANDDTTVMREDEVLAAVEAAHSVGRLVNAHCRSAGSVKRAARCGVDVIYHCEHADAEALDLLEAARDRVFAGPAIGLPVNAAELHARPGGDAFLRAGFERCLERAAAAYGEMRRRGVRVVIGGDYGFGITPQGTNARDIEHFVRLFGYSPAEALVCATRVGGELMGRGSELGRVAPGYLADFLLVDGDPLANVAILQDPGRLAMIVKNGEIHKFDRSAMARRLAAE